MQDLQSQKKDIFQVPATITKIETLADKSLKLKVITQELNEKQSEMVFKLYNKIGWFVFSEADIKNTDLINLPDVKGEFSDKTPSQRLRNVIWRLQEQKIGKEPNAVEFRKFYEDYMEGLISKMKELLN